MKGRHISSNIRLVLDLIDYSDAIDSDVVVFFWVGDFCKTFDTIEHEFLFRSLKPFGFGENCIKVICMFYKDINSSVLLNLNTSKRFEKKCMTGMTSFAIFIHFGYGTSIYRYSE